MATNPFIAFAQDPVGALTWLAYAFLFVAIAFAALRTVLRGFPTLWNQYQSNKHTSGKGGWWSFGDRSAGYIPPLGWSIKFFGYLLVLAVASWATSALVWHVGGA